MEGETEFRKRHYNQTLTGSAAEANGTRSAGRAVRPGGSAHASFGLATAGWMGVLSSHADPRKTGSPDQV